jgi:hypothetical protein
MARVCPSDPEHWRSVGDHGDAQFCGKCGAELVVEQCCQKSADVGYEHCIYCGRKTTAGK